ncbi:MAG TPA: TIGR00730 family Rossman fold protein [Mariprofundaceae bacterium]|nr:TIGR00730 family Rossman fold protein [Mariprofundaceae bacterium]
MTELTSIDDLPKKISRHAHKLLKDYAGDSPYKRALIIEALKLVSGDYETSDIKMLSRVLGELRHGLDVFQPYQAFRKVSVFGSARTASTSPSYIQARECGAALKDAGFMVITGGGGGMMQAANEGATEKNSFAININLPMEQEPNPIMDGSPRHFYCQYFFTRKVFFLKESDAVILTPGGFGTLDEGFECLTLLQTGRNPPIPVILLEAPGEDYWGPFMHSWMRRLVNDHLISPDDHHLLYHTDSVAAAVRYIEDYYTNYHSFRYVGDSVLLRINNPLSAGAMEQLNAEFSDVLSSGKIDQVFQWPKSDDECFDHLPRLRLHLDRNRMNALPQIIRRMNALHQQDSSSRFKG